jgi:purine-nucleoside/S-methyl-5'-thioadenosine phosphorylase / adenosine deaminase
MPFHQSGTLRYYTFDSLDEAGLFHAVFTRQGGVSPQPWDSLNLGGTVGDDAVRVAQNRQRVFLAIGRNLDSIFDVWQVHSAEVVCASSPRRPHIPHNKADAILTDSPDVTLLMRFADCVPILLYDPTRHVAGLVHSGWPGTVKQVARVAVEAMHKVYGSEPRSLLAAIGPSIGAHHYEIGPNVEEQVRLAFKNDAAALLPSANGGVQFDLWAANRLILESCGIRQIEVAGLCTACHREDWFSHRGDKGRTGRFGVLLGLGQ